MADREELLRLADEIAAASGPDRELDALIAVALGYAGRSILTATPFTASLDAAMALVPEEHDICVEKVSGRHYASVTVEGCSFEERGMGPLEAATPALALAAASLRARAQDPLRAHGGGE